MGKKGATTPIDWGLVAELCRIHCTKDEIIGVINASSSMKPISTKTFDRQIKRELNLTFDAYFAMHSANGCMSLRRQQWASALGLKRKRTVYLKERIKQPDGTIIERQVPTEVDYYPPPSERMQIWIGQQILKQSLNTTDKPVEHVRDGRDVQIVWQTLGSEKQPEEFFDQKEKPPEESSTPDENSS